MEQGVTMAGLLAEGGAELWLLLAASAAIAYFCGCFNGAVLVSKYILQDDVRGHGSGNAGLTNFYRTFGGPLTALVILTDAVKAVVAFALGVALLSRFILVTDEVLPFSKYWAALFCMLGHMFPCMFHFKGGKGILSGGVFALLIDWRVALVVWGGFILLAALTRYVSLGSCWAGASFPVVSWLVYRSVPVLVLALLCGGLILWQHRANIQRLLQGRENKFHLRKKGGGGKP